MRVVEVSGGVDQVRLHAIEEGAESGDILGSVVAAARRGVVERQVEEVHLLFRHAADAGGGHGFVAPDQPFPRVKLA